VLLSEDRNTHFYQLLLDAE